MPRIIPGLVYSGVGSNPSSPMFLSLIFFTLTCHHRVTCTVRSREKLHRGGDIKVLDEVGIDFQAEGPARAKARLGSQTGMWG